MRLFTRLAASAAPLSPFFLLGGCSIINRLFDAAATHLPPRRRRVPKGTVMKLLKRIFVVVSLITMATALTGCGHGGNLITHTLI